MSKERTGTIKCNLHWYENEWPILKELLNIRLVHVEINRPSNNVYLIRCTCDKFDIADNWPEYIFSLNMKDGNLNVKSIENTGRILMNNYE